MIFDMDGVLIDSFEPHRKAFDIVMRKQFGFKVTKEEFLKLFGSDPRGITRKLVEDHGIKEMQDIEKLHAEKQETFRRLIKGEVRVFPGVRKLLTMLKKSGLKTGLASSNSRKNIMMIMEKVGLKGYFNVFTGLEDTKKAKPSPEIYLKTAEKLQVKPEDCWVIEDSLHGIEAGKKAGMKVIGVQTGLRSERELIEAGADKVVENLWKLSIRDIELTSRFV